MKHPDKLIKDCAEAERVFITRHTAWTQGRNWPALLALRDASAAYTAALSAAVEYCDGLNAADATRHDAPACHQ